MKQFLRWVKVEIEDADRAVLIIEELRVAFDLHLEAQAASSPSTVKIWNLAKSSASHISGDNQIARVWAGYGDARDTEPLVQGEIRRVLHEREGLDRVTTIVLGESDSAKSGTVVSIGQAGPVSLRWLVEQIVGAMGLGIRELEVVPDEQLDDGYHHNGPAGTALKNLLEPRGVTPYEVSGVMHFSRSGEGARIGGFLLDKDTGLIGSPSVTENDGARAKMALNGSIELGQTVEIDSEALKGYFKVRAIVHRGDNWDGEFVTEIEGMKA